MISKHVNDLCVEPPWDSGAFENVTLPSILM